MVPPSWLKTAIRAATRMATPTIRANSIRGERLVEEVMAFMEEQGMGRDYDSPLMISWRSRGCEEHLTFLRRP